ncbi:4-hydroxybenzoate 3-monooxygenase [Kineococcus sp. GCM10028916]|uniref:4-hydroxybenzoate 3-monooxygenase n=1 Tax=Kineococcus sp. GCM10028916 TaxID=3273394 RepID=UPI0036314734
MRTEVAIIGAGPAGMLLSHLLAGDGVESVVLETRSEAHVAARIRAGVLEQSTIDVLTNAGLGDRLAREGGQHQGIYLTWPEDDVFIDFEELTGRSTVVYGQGEVQKDLITAAHRRGQQVVYEVSDTQIHDIDTVHPCVTYTDADGNPARLDAAVIAGCDGSFGPSRSAVPEEDRTRFERSYPHSWLGVLAQVAPSTDHVRYAWHPDGFAMHSMRSPSVSRLYLQVPAGTDVAEWSDDRIWSTLSTRLGSGRREFELISGPITEKSVLAMRSLVQTPMRSGRLFLAGDAAHILPPTGAKGLNLAVADVALLAPALVGLVRKDDPESAGTYSQRALARVWRATHFAWWMTSMLHSAEDPFQAQLQLSQLRWLARSRAARTDLAENFAGVDLHA